MRRLAFLTPLIFALSLGLTFKASSQSVTGPWAFFAELTSPGLQRGLFTFTVPLEVMGKAREDLSDLRIFDASGKEIPYALRIRREVDDRRVVGGNLFNRVNAGPTASEVTVDLGEDPGEHNEVEIDTEGTNFRRRVNVEGADSPSDWKLLQAGVLIFRFQSQNQTAQDNRVSYPTSRYRYLRIRVFSDELTDSRPPIITNVSAVKSLRAKGELTAWQVNDTGYQLLRNQGAPSSAWNIDLGAPVPCDRLILNIADESFSRPFQVEAGDDPQSMRLVASGELARRLGEERRDLVIRFDQEERARKLRLVFMDYSNNPLNVTSIQAAVPARQLVFELKETAALPLRLFFGNAKATAPHYDFEKEPAAGLSTNPNWISLGPLVNNPEYKPEPLPLTERVPWLIYVVLSVSSVVLALILFSLARTTMRRDHNKSPESGEVSA